MWGSRRLCVLRTSRLISTQMFCSFAGDEPLPANFSLCGKSHQCCLKLLVDDDPRSRKRFFEDTSRRPEAAADQSFATVPSLGDFVDAILNKTFFRIAFSDHVDVSSDSNRALVVFPQVLWLTIPPPLAAEHSARMRPGVSYAPIVSSGALLTWRGKALCLPGPRGSELLPDSSFLPVLEKLSSFQECLSGRRIVVIPIISSFCRHFKSSAAYWELFPSAWGKRCLASYLAEAIWLLWWMRRLLPI